MPKIPFADKTQISAYDAAKINATDINDLKKGVDRLYTEFHSKDFASGNGTTDDTAALNTFLNVQANNVHLHFDEGTYKISNVLFSNAVRANVKITASPGAKIVPTSTFPQTNSNFFLENITNLHIDGITIEGNGAIASPALNTYNNGMNGIYVKNSTDILIENSKFFSQAKAAVFTEDCDEVKIINNRVPLTYNYAFWVRGTNKICKNIYILHNISTGQGQAQHDATTLGMTPGILVTKCDYVRIIGNHLDDFKNTGTKTEGCNHVKYIANTVLRYGKDGIKAQAFEPEILTVTDIEILGNTIEFMYPFSSESGGAILVHRTTKFNVSDNIITGGVRGTADGASEDGIFIIGDNTTYRTAKGIVSRNIINRPGRCGIYMESVDDTIVDGNEIYNYGVDGGPTQHGIWARFCRRNKFSANIIHNDTAPTSGFGSGINIGDSSINNCILGGSIRNPRENCIRLYTDAADIVEISGVHMFNALGASVQLGGTGVLKVLKLNGNVIFDPADPGFNINTTGQSIVEVDATNNTLSATGARPLINLYGGTAGSISKLIESGNSISGQAIASVYGTVATLRKEDGIWRGTGNPEGVVPASPGAFYSSITGAFYLKTSLTGNTGWTLK